ncbi:MAG: tyrosine-type recombinase/integrase [Alphaproteobacteria bacterium]|jgi:integrase|nr:tyrosine-type recombinase/integrase [Alphaproteobacteria bacterium]
MPLTELAIKALKPKTKLYRVADSGGLCLEVSPVGGKLWRWRYNYHGKGQMLALGKYPAVSLAEARRLRDAARDLLDAGKHPTREKKAQKLRNFHAGENTFEKVTRAWLELKQSGMNEKYRKQCLERLEQHVFPYIGPLPVSEITIPDVVRVVEKIAKRGTVETAKRMKQLIGQTFRYASQRGLCEHNPAADLRDILPSAEEKHHPCIPPAELPNLLKAMRAYQGDRLVVLAMELLVLTFPRTNELIGAKWEEIDWKREEWNVPKERMKMKRPHMIPLSRQALSILKELQTLTGDKPFIFYSSRSKSRHLSNGCVLMALRRMKYGGRMCGHGFRALASTILNEKGYNPDWIECQLAHQDADKIRSAYNRAEYVLERKKMMQDYANMLEAMANNKDSVVPLKAVKCS